MFSFIAHHFHSFILYRSTDPVHAGWDTRPALRTTITRILQSILTIRSFYTTVRLVFILHFNFMSTFVRDRIHNTPLSSQKLYMIHQSLPAIHRLNITQASRGWRSDLRFLRTREISTIWHDWAGWSSRARITHRPWWRGDSWGSSGRRCVDCRRWGCAVRDHGC